MYILFSSLSVAALMCPYLAKYIFTVLSDCISRFLAEVLILNVFCSLLCKTASYGDKDIKYTFHCLHQLPGTEILQSSKTLLNKHNKNMS